MTIDDILKKATAFMESQLLLSAHELGLFDLIGENSTDASDLAQKAGLSERGLTILLDALSALSLLNKSGKCYSNTEEGLKYLCQNSSAYRGATLDHMAGMRDMWLRLSESVRTGTTARKEGESLVYNKERNRKFILAMRDVSAANAKVIAEKLDLSPYKNLLDLGGGPGTYTIEILKENPQMHATLLDLPLTLDVAREVIAESGMTDRISLKEGDFFGNDNCDMGNDYDLVVISNILHIEGEENNRKLLNKVYSAMKSGAMVIIHEAIINDDRTSPVDRALFAINMLVHTERGNCYTFDEMKSWLENSRFDNIEFIDCFEKPSLMRAYKK